MKKKLLSPEQAFRAMLIFLNEYDQRTAGKAELGDVGGYSADWNRRHAG